MSSNERLRVGIAGLGTVGVGVVKILQSHANAIMQRSGQSIEIAGISAKTKDKDRGVDLSSYAWFDDPVSLAKDPDIDVVLELIGGSDGVAKNVVEVALESRKSVVTANKALLAHHGIALAKLAESKDVTLAYEAAVAGGIPIIKAMREGFAANQCVSVCGILNGTCNYVLTEMQRTGQGFEDILKEAQDKGYAEADPTFDVDGIDAAHKLVLLASLAFGVEPDFENLKIVGIRSVSIEDIHYAEELGYMIKLLGRARLIDKKLSYSVEPCLVAQDNPISGVEGVFNAVMVEGDFVGQSMLVGRGAGEGPTASSVVADIVDIARGFSLPTFGIKADLLKTAELVSSEVLEDRFYIHMHVADQPGVIAEITNAFKQHGVSIEAFVQKGRDPGNNVSVVILTHETKESDMNAVIADVQTLERVLEKPKLMRIV